MTNFTDVNEISIYISQTNYKTIKMEKTSKLMEIEIAKINPSPRNPRKTFAEAELDELAQNIRNQGLLQPITVRPIGKAYEIVCGERRYRAVKKNAEQDKAKKPTIACIVKELSDEEAFEAMITENLQRKDVDPIEEAFAFGELVKAGKSEDEIAARFGKTKRFVQERCKLNTLITPLKELTTSGSIPIAGAIKLAKLKEDLQEKYSEEIKSRYEAPSDVDISIRDIDLWITREFMDLENADFLEYDEDDETQPPTEEWNKSFEKCASCCMNTGNSGCLFYSMKGEHRCTDRQCFENKTVAYWFSKIEQYGDRLTKDGKKIQVGNVVIVDGGDESYGYANVKVVRKRLLQLIREKGYMIASPAVFDGKCKYYGDDERIPKLLKQEKIVECITLGTTWCLDVETCYYYVKGQKDADPDEDPVAREARELAEKYDKILNKMNSDANDELRKWCSEKQYSERKGKLSDKEDLFFWSFIVLSAGHDIIRESGATEFSDQEKIIGYVKNNLTEENMVRWQRAFMNKIMYDKSTYNKLAQRAMRECFRIAYPKPFEELVKKHADKFEKRTEKIKLRLEEIGYNVKGKKISGES